VQRSKLTLLLATYRIVQNLQRAIDDRTPPFTSAKWFATSTRPPEVVPTLFDITLSVLGDLRSGWALWNFRGPFGVLDTQRAGTKFEDWNGHQFDRPLLALPQKKQRSRERSTASQACSPLRSLRPVSANSAVKSFLRQRKPRPTARMRGTNSQPGR